MVTVSEVVVGLRSEGAEDTKDDLEGVTDQTEETTQQLQAQSDQMTELAQSFSGALKAATVGLAVASAGLLSQVPVLGQAFDGLFAIVNSVALAMDTVLRPVLTPLTNKMFELSQAINESGAPIKTLIGILATVATVITGLLLGPVGVLGATLGGLGAGAILALADFQKFKRGLTKVAQFVRENAPKAFEKFKQKASGLIKRAANQIQQNLPKIVRALIQFGKKVVSKLESFAKNTNFKQLGRDIMNGIVTAIERFVRFAKPVVDDIAKVIEDEFNNYGWEQLGRDVVKAISLSLKNRKDLMVGAGEVLVDEFADVFEDYTWKEMGKAIINGLTAGIRARFNFLKGVVKETAQMIADHLPSSPAKKGPLSDIDEAGPGLVDEFAGGITSNLGRLKNAGQQAANAADGRGGGRTLPGSQTTTTQVFLNGRQLGQGTSGERFDESARRGQTF